MGYSPCQAKVRVLVNPNRDYRWGRLPVNLREKDVSDLRDDTLRVGEIGIGTKPIYRREFGEIYLGCGLEGKILEPVIPALEIRLPLKTQGIQTCKILLAE